VCQDINFDGIIYTVRLQQYYILTMKLSLEDPVTLAINVLMARPSGTFVVQESDNHGVTESNPCS
jgi:hypothetical protein